MPSAPPNTAETKPRPRRRLRGAVAVLALGALTCAVFAAAMPGPTPPPETAEPVVKILAPVEVIPVVLRDLSEDLALSGEVRPIRKAVISAEVSGIAGAVALQPGETVAAGDPLLSIAPEDFRLALQTAVADLARLRAQIATAQSSLDRVSRLAARGAASTASEETAEGAVDVLKMEIAAAELRVRQAEINLGRATLRAPITGTIASRTVEPGQLVQAGAALFEIVELEVVTVEATVPLARAAALRPGQAARFRAPEAPGREIAARVVRISPQAVAGTRAAMVWLEIDNAGPALRGGTFLTGEIALRRAEGRIALPRAALRDGSSVLALRDGRAVLVPVTTGADWAGLIEITAGLAPGDQVVALPLAGLAAGDSVRIAEE